MSVSRASMSISLRLHSVVDWGKLDQLLASRVPTRKIQRKTVASGSERDDERDAT